MLAKIRPYAADIDIVAPPSKSYAHRLIIAAALGEKTVTVKNVGSSADVLATARCVEALGAKVGFSGKNVEITGIFASERIKTAVLNCGESGSTLRFLMPIAAALGISAKFTGEGRLLSRPNEILFSLLKTHGVDANGYEISGRLKSGDFVVDASVSSQYITGLMLALPLISGDSEIILKGKPVSENYIDITFDVLDLAGIKYEKSESAIKIFGNRRFDLPSEVTCEGDWSGAAFPLVIGAISGKAKVGGLNCNSAQGDKKIADILAQAGANLSYDGEKYTATKSEIRAFKADMENCPDLAPIACVLAAKAKGESEISGVLRLKIKESDRLKAVCDMLTVAGVKFSFDGEKFKISGGETLGGEFNGYSDHRIVMAATALAISSSGESEISCAEATAKSYPEFFEAIAGGNNVEVVR